MAAAQRRVFRLILIEQVEDEARRALQAAGIEEQLDTLLEPCWVLRQPNATPRQLKRHKRAILVALRHDADADVGVAVRCARPKIRIFVSSNRRHWRNNPETKAALGGCVAMKSRQFANLINPD
jgi:hypothetical protein